MFEKHTDLFVFGHLLWNKIFHYGIMYHFLKIKVVPNVPIYIPLARWIQLRCCNGVSIERKISLSIFQAMTWVRLSLFLQAK